jgi:hypothetical protein
MPRVILFLLAIAVTFPALGFGRITLSEQDDSFFRVSESEEIRDSVECRSGASDFENSVGNDSITSPPRIQFAARLCLNRFTARSLLSAHFSRPPPALL